MIDSTLPTARGLTGRTEAAPLRERAGDLLPPLDALLIGAAGALAVTLFAPPAIDDAATRLPWVAALGAPFLLYDPRFAELAHDGLRAPLAAFGRRVIVFLAVFVAVGDAIRGFDAVPWEWVGAWLGSGLSAVALARLLLARHLRATVRTSASRSASGNDTAQRVAQVVDGVPIELVADRPIRRWDAVVKAAFDYGVGALITLALLPLLGLIALAVRLDGPGPVLFRQRRHGIDNREFDIYKFRTMRYEPAASNQELQQTRRGDARVTRVGRFLRKWSLDELPQLFNVLAGDMSLVGPRPHAVVMRTQARLGHEIVGTYPHRHRVKPGITGWAQINGSRGATDTAEQLRRRVELDLYYVENWSLWLDLRILVLTVREVLRATNAF